MPNSINTSKHPSTTCERIFSAFPRKTKEDVEEVLGILPVAKHEVHEIVANVILPGGEHLRIPSRVYFPEPTQKSIESLSDIQKDILAAILTRHHDGYVREKNLRFIITKQRPWIVPYIFQLTGEYVIEILKYQSDNVELLKTEIVAEFFKNNSEYRYQLCQKVFSYWNCYFWLRNQIFVEHYGYKVLQEIGAWDTSVAKKRIRRANKHLHATT